MSKKVPSASPFPSVTDTIIRSLLETPLTPQQAEAFVPEALSERALTFRKAGRPRMPRSIR